MFYVIDPNTHPVIVAYQSTDEKAATEVAKRYAEVHGASQLISSKGAPKDFARTPINPEPAMSRDTPKDGQ